ncbi:nicotinate (nicotinamide) nucleotide adenylyltransferase [Persephonella sp.]
MVGLYGGSFDPVHIGHLRIAEDIREFFSFERIIFIPAYISPLKTASYAPAEDRLQMLRLSIRHNPYFAVDDFELKKGGRSYTIDTFIHYRKRGVFPFFILGSDAFLSFHRWKSPEKLLETGSFIVVGRGSDNIEKLREYLSIHFPYVNLELSNKLKEQKNTVYFFDSRRIDVSSTEIRQRVKEEKSIKYLVLPQVENYILEKKLYRG